MFVAQNVTTTILEKQREHFVKGLMNRATLTRIMIYNDITNCKGVSCLVVLLNINNNSEEREKLTGKLSV